MRVDQEIEKLKSDIFSDDRDKMKASVNRLFEIGGQENIDYLIGLLDQENGSIRNAVSLTFRDFKFNEAVEPLFRAIHKKENKGDIETLVYSLQTLDCKNKLKELFDLVFYGSYGVQNIALNILDEQEFEFSEEDLINIKTKWDDCKVTWDKRNHIDPDNPKTLDLDKDLIQNIVDGYVSYLEKS